MTQMKRVYIVPTLERGNDVLFNPPHPGLLPQGRKGKSAYR